MDAGAHAMADVCGFSPRGLRGGAAAESLIGFFLTRFEFSNFHLNCIFVSPYNINNGDPPRVLPKAPHKCARPPKQN